MKLTLGILVLLLLNALVVLAAEITNIPDFGTPYTRTFAGYYATEADKQSQAYYFFAEAEKNASSAPIFVWFSGAPGCSSLRGAFYDIGPYDYTLTTTALNTTVYAPVRNNKSWTKFANLLFIEAPVGTGYSYFQGAATLPTTLTAAAQQITNVLLAWYTDNRAAYSGKVYLVGQNFGAKLAQLVGNSISNSIVPYNGLIMGNPWIDPAVQHHAWVEFSYISGFIALGQRISLNSKVAACTQQLNNNQYSNAFYTCWSILDAIKNQTGVDTNDFITRSLDGRFSTIEDYLNRQDVRTALQSDSRAAPSYKFCNSRLFDILKPEIEKSTADLLPSSIQKTNVLIYNGEHDFAANSYGVRELIYDKMAWTGRALFNFANSQVFNYQFAPAGNFIQAANLTYVLLYNSGPDPAREQPDVLADVLKKFISKASLCPPTGCTAEIVTCPNKCSGHGTCVNNKCVCANSWSGSDCSAAKMNIDAKNGIPKFNGYLFANSWNEMVLYVPDYSIYFNVLSTDVVQITLTVQQTSSTGDIWLHATSLPITGIYQWINNTRFAEKVLTFQVPPKSYIKVGILNFAEGQEATYSFTLSGVPAHKVDVILQEVIGLNFLYGFIVGAIVTVVLVLILLFVRCIVRCRQRYKRGRRMETSDDD